MVPLQTQPGFNLLWGMGGRGSPAFSDTRRRERFQGPWKGGVWKRSSRLRRHKLGPVSASLPEIAG